MIRETQHDAVTAGDLPAGGQCGHLASEVLSEAAADGLGHLELSSFGSQAGPTALVSC